MAFGERSTRTLATVAAVCCLGLTWVFVYANPFSRPVPSPLWTTLLTLWVVGLAVAILDFPKLMLAVFVVSCPFGLYFAVSSPSVFSLIGVFTTMYGVAATRRQSQQRSNAQES